MDTSLTRIVLPNTFNYFQCNRFSNLNLKNENHLKTYSNKLNLKPFRNEKSILFTTSLILRNIGGNSFNGKRTVRAFSENDAQSSSIKTKETKVLESELADTISSNNQAESTLKSCSSENLTSIPTETQEIAAESTSESLKPKIDSNSTSKTEDAAATAAEVNEQLDEDGDEDDGNLSSSEDEELEMEKGFKMKRVCDKLVDVFYTEKTTPSEWRKLLAFSKEWCRIRPHFYKRCRARAKEMEDPGKRADLFKLARRLKEVDDDMVRHDDLLTYIESEEDLNAVVFKRRLDFTSGFFEHLRLLCDVNYDNIERREELIALANRIVTAVNTYDNFVENEAVLAPAQLKFDDIMNSPSLDAACAKIDDLSRRKEFDPALMLLFTKAWSAAKESTMMKDEVKDVMYHMYLKARESMQRLVPKEVRIMRHIITMDDPRERMEALTSAFSPGDEYEGKDEDYLYTTPKRLHKWIVHVLDAYYTNRENTLIQEAQKLMNPMIIKKIEIMKDMIEDQFM